MNKKKITGLLLTGAMVMSTVAPMSVYAADATTKTGTVPVTYKSGNVIQPDGAKWGVMVPSAISFNDSKSEQAVDVELVPLDGSTELEDSLQVGVTVESANEYKLASVEASDNKVGYTLTYGGTVMTSTEKAVATLSKANAATTGALAELTGTANSTAARTDTLTYTVTKQ